MIGIVAFVATVWLVGVSTIEHHLREIGWFFVVLCSIELLSSIIDGTAIYFMAHGEGRPTWRETIVAQIVGRGVNSVTPGGNLGEAVKVGLLSQRCSPRRIVAAVMYVGLIHVVISFAVIAIGSAATAFMFDVPRIARIGLLLCALGAAAISVTIVVLIHRGMLSTLARALARLRLLSKERRERWHETLVKVDARLQGIDDGVYRRRAIVCGVICSCSRNACCSSR